MSKPFLAFSPRGRAYSLASGYADLRRPRPPPAHTVDMRDRWWKTSKQTKERKLRKLTLVLEWLHR